MSYAQKKELSGNRTLSVVFTVVVVGSLLYAIVTGLAFNVIKKSVANLKTFDVETPPPPPEKPPPPPKEIPKVPPPPITPPSIIKPPVETPPPIQTVVSPIIPPPQPVIAPPAPPPPPAAKVTKAQSARGDLQNYFTGDDYPPDALRNEDTGTTVVRVNVGADGRVASCDVVSSSGSRSLDSATCRVLRSRARFTPAKLSNGQATTDSITARITWRLQ